MARMLPATIDPATVSGGEREIFYRLAEDPGTEGWTVLHSLGVAHHETRTEGEIDFVVVIPGKGVLCVEVKAAIRIRCESGIWYYGRDTHRDPRGPFRQAGTAMHSIRKRLADRLPDLRNVVFWSAVVFPYAEFNIESEEWHQWQLIDARAFRARPIGALLEGVLDRARQLLADRAAWFRPDGGPTPEQCSKIVELLRPDFEFFEPPRLRAARVDAELKHYTAEQFAALDAMEDNLRVAFSGPAGTGKTLLALEAARRGVHAGRRVLLVCFNRLLGRWLQEQTAELGSAVVCSTLHRRMLDVAGITPPSGADPHFWHSELPLTAMESLVDRCADCEPFDELILDEAQDLLRDEYLDFLDLSLAGGLAAGRWRFFGDFERQAIYEPSVSLPQFTTTRGSGAPIYSLRTNCRNTPRIAEFARLLGGLDPAYSRILRPDDGLEPEIRYYADADGQRRVLLAVLEEVYKEGFRGRDVVVLSPRADGGCACSLTEIPWRDRLRDYESCGKGHLPFCSVHAFKGLEARVVVVTDVESIDGAYANALFYVAATRALQRLYVLAHTGVKREVIAMLFPSQTRTMEVG